MADISKETIIALLRRWIAQRPGLEPVNYGDAASYRAESRSITQDGKHAQILLSYVENRASLTVDMLLKGFHAYSGRLSLERDDKRQEWRLSYTTGQYWPTEYRRAVCAVLASVIWDYWRGDAQPDNFGVVCTGDDGRRIAASSKRWGTREGADAYASTVAQSRRPEVQEFYAGAHNLGDYLRAKGRHEFGRAIGNRWFD